MQEQRQVFYDADLQVEAYRLSGVVRKFPNHFHDYYVIGFIESGARRLWCREKEYELHTGDMLLFQPGDNHYCAPVNGMPLDYRAVNIKSQRMADWMLELTACTQLPVFLHNVVRQSETALLIAALYDAIVSHASRLEREEACCFLLEQVLAEHASLQPWNPEESKTGLVQKVCRYMAVHVQRSLSLEELAQVAGVSKNQLLRLFAKEKGISPYRYLQSLRVQRAKELLEQQVPPLEAAFASGFSDQSHFTNYFKTFIGLTPKQYQRIFLQEETGIEQK